MLGGASEHHQCAQLHQLLPDVDGLWKSMALFPTIGWETICVQITGHILKLRITLYVFIRGVEFIDDLSNEIFHSLPQFESIIPVVVSWQQIRVVHTSALHIALYVGPMNVVCCPAPSHQLPPPFTPNGKHLVNDSTIIDQSLSGMRVNGHGVAEVRPQKPVHWVSIWEVTHDAHSIGFHDSVTGQVMSNNLVKLKMKVRKTVIYNVVTAQRPFISTWACAHW